MSESKRDAIAREHAESLRYDLPEVGSINLYARRFASILASHGVGEEEGEAVIMPTVEEKTHAIRELERLVTVVPFGKVAIERAITLLRSHPEGASLEALNAAAEYFENEAEEWQACADDTEHPESRASAQDEAAMFRAYAKAVRAALNSGPEGAVAREADEALEALEYLESELRYCREESGRLPRYSISDATMDKYLATVRAALQEGAEGQREGADEGGGE